MPFRASPYDLYLPTATPVRRAALAAGHAVEQIGAPAAWYDAFQPPAAYGAAVASWPDRSGAGRHATQGTGSAQPAYIQASTINGRPALRFDGGDYLTAGTGWAASAYTVFAVFACDILIDASSDQYGVWAIASGPDDRFMLWTGGPVAASRLSAFAQLSGTAESSNYETNIAAGTPLIATVVWQDAGMQQRVNGAAQTLQNTAITPSSLGASAELRIGQRMAASFANGFDGDIGEYILFSRALSAGAIARVEQYLAAKWGIALSG